jgi:hypothetical protein
LVSLSGNQVASGAVSDAFLTRQQLGENNILAWDMKEAKIEGFFSLYTFENCVFVSASKQNP